MIIYEQTTGKLSIPNWGSYLGYSGYGRWKNNPDFEFAHEVGPVPAGTYLLSEPFDDAVHGPICFRLTPTKDTQTFGRTGLMIHGDNGNHPGSASHGCVALGHDARAAIRNCGERSLQVIEVVKP